MAENLEFVLNKTFQFSNETVQVIKDSLGPSGLDTLICTTSGTLLMTSDGFQVLKSFSSCSPIGKLIFQGLEMFYKNTGDFSKKFIFLTREMLSEVLDITSAHKTSSTEQIVRISQGMEGLMNGINIPNVFDKLQTMKVVKKCPGKIDDIQNFVISIVKTSVSGKFSPKTSEILIGLIQQLLFADKESNDITHLRQATDKLLDSFSDTVWEVPGKPFSCSTILPGIIIPREFVTIIKKLPCLLGTTSFKFVVLGASLGYDIPQSDTVLLVKDSLQVNNVFQWRRIHIENAVKILRKHEVELIITSSTLHETFVHICNQNNIAAIHLIPQEDILRISNVFGISPLFEVNEDFTSCIGIASACKPIQVGQHKYVHVEPTKTPVKQLLLCAPTQPLCHQYSIALQNMLKVLRSAFKECPGSSYVLSYVNGGGAFELAFAYALEEYRKVNRLKPNISLACQILEKALLSIPKQLAKNSGSSLSIFELQAKTREALRSEKQMFCLNRNGGLDFRNEGIIEPTMANYLLISSVLQLAVQILRTDKVVHVKTLPNKNVLFDSDDSDNETNIE